MPTKLDKSTIKDLGESSSADNIEKVVNKADTTLNSVERIAGKVESIISMIGKLKASNKQEQAPTTFKNVAPEKPKLLKQNGKIKIDTSQAIKQLNEFLENLDNKKTIEDAKKEINKAQKLGMLNKIVESFILNNCEIEYD